MTGAPFASPDDVAAIWRPLTPAETATVAAWIDIASQQIRDEVPLVAGLTIDQRMALPSSDPDVLADDTVKNVCRQMVFRQIATPAGVQEIKEEFGTYSSLKVFVKPLAAGELSITTAEMQRLTATAANRPRKQVAFSITPAQGMPNLPGPARRWDGGRWPGGHW